MIMKKRIFTVLAAALVLVGCHNFDTDFPDYKYTTGYFPYQFPVRTIVLGNDQTPNDNDNAGKFSANLKMRLGQGTGEASIQFVNDKQKISAKYS